MENTPLIIVAGVRLLNRSVLQRIHWQWRLLPFQGKDDVCAFKASLTFIDAVSEIYSALLSGHTLVVFPVPVVKDVTKFVKGKNIFASNAQKYSKPTRALTLNR